MLLKAKVILCSGLQRFCRPSTFSHISEAAGPILAIFSMEPPSVMGTKLCLGGLVHITKMAAIPIFVKGPLKIFVS